MIPHSAVKQIVLCEFPASSRPDGESDMKKLTSKLAFAARELRLHGVSVPSDETGFDSSLVHRQMKQHHEAAAKEN